MRLVILESPFQAPTPELIERNVAYARAAVMDCLSRGEAPYASHIFFTQPGLLDDSIPQQRALGILAGLAWGKKADATVVYCDLGTDSPGVKHGIERARAEGRPVEERYLGAGWNDRGFA